jgi:DNA repair protein RadC
MPRKRDRPTGTANAAQVHAREIFQRAIVAGAVSIILAHNHPSSVPTPSNADKAMTRKVIDCGAILGIPVSDHVIVTDELYVSLHETTDIF